MENVFYCFSADTMKREASNLEWSVGLNLKWPPLKWWKKSQTTRDKTQPCLRGRSGTGCWRRASATTTPSQASHPLTGKARYRHKCCAWLFMCDILELAWKEPKLNIFLIKIVKILLQARRHPQQKTAQLSAARLAEAARGLWGAIQSSAANSLNNQQYIQDWVNLSRWKPINIRWPDPVAL